MTDSFNKLQNVKVPSKVAKIWEDLPNYVDPMTCSDKFERVKYYFPFYRTDMNHFQEKLDSIESEDMKLNEIKTSFTTLSAIK